MDVLCIFCVFETAYAVAEVLLQRMQRNAPEILISPPSKLESEINDTRPLNPTRLMIEADLRSLDPMYFVTENEPAQLESGICVIKSDESSHS
jgi:hypothetical protein